MSYQRWGKPERFYIWASKNHDKSYLFVVPPENWTGSNDHGVEFDNTAAGLDNAKATLTGLVEFLYNEGIEVSVKNGKTILRKKER